jgi:hypothetical protein
MSRRPNRRQLRRRARQARRDGYQPFMVINSDEFPDTLPSVIAHWTWRYRSELAPFAAAIATALTALILHNEHPTSWPWLIVATAAMLAILAAPLPQWARKTWGVLERPAERVYVAVVIAALGGWLTAATAIGPRTSPMPALGLAFTVACGIPWWISRRRRSKVRIERKLESWPDVAHTIGLAGSQVMSALVDVWGWRARIRLARGQTIHDVIARIPAIESALGTFRGAVRVYPTTDDLANRCELRVLDIDPHANAITCQDHRRTASPNRLTLARSKTRHRAVCSSCDVTCSSEARPEPARAADSMSSSATWPRVTTWSSGASISRRAWSSAHGRRASIAWPPRPTKPPSFSPTP